MGRTELVGDGETDPLGIVAPYPGESRADACRRWAREDEIEEDPVKAAREQEFIRALKDEELFVEDLGRRSLESMPTALRKLYKQNPANPRVRALYDQMTQELYDRANDVMRASLLDATEELTALLDCPDEKVRFRAATYLIERLMGKTPEVIEHRQDKPFQVVLERLVVGPRMARTGTDDRPAIEEAIDAEVVSEAISEPKTREPVKITRTRRQRKTRN